jgi:hypothetical protein
MYLHNTFEVDNITRGASRHNYLVQEVIPVQVFRTSIWQANLLTTKGVYLEQLVLHTCRVARSAMPVPHLAAAAGRRQIRLRMIKEAASVGIPVATPYQQARLDLTPRNTECA